MADDAVARALKEHEKPLKPIFLESHRSLPAFKEALAAMGEKFMSPLWPFSLKVRGALYEKFKIEKPQLLQPVEAYLKAKTAKPTTEVTTSAQETKTQAQAQQAQHAQPTPSSILLPSLSVVVSPGVKKIDLLSEEDKEEIEKKLSLISEGATES